MVKLGDIQFLINPLARKEGILEKRKIALRWAVVVNKIIKINLGYSAFLGTDAPLKDAGLVKALRWSRVIKKILLEKFGMATFMLNPEDSKKNLIRLRWARVLKKIKGL
jgi:hypothetical protein